MYEFSVAGGAQKENILDLYKHFEFSDSFTVDMYGSGMASNYYCPRTIEEKVINVFS